MTDRLFQMLDWGCDTFLKLMLGILFIGCGIFLAVTAGTFGLCLFLIIGCFLKWAFTDSANSSHDPLALDEDGT